MRLVSRFFSLGISIVAISCASAAPPSHVAQTPPPKIAPTTTIATPRVPNVAEERVITPRLTYIFRASRLSNLLYQLDCLSGLTRCSRIAYAELWKKELGDQEGDADALDAWRALRDRYRGDITRSDQEASTPLPIPAPDRSIEMAARLAGYGTVNENTYFSRLSLFIDASDVDLAKSIVDRFSDRFDRFWKARQPDLARGLSEYAALVSRADVASILESAQHFYDPQFSKNQTETFDLIARTDHDSPDSGEQLVDHSLIEVRPGEKPEHRFGVVMHELFHAWFAASPYAKQVALSQAFASSSDPVAVPAYGLLDEVLATDFGNGLVNRAVDPNDFERRQNKPRGMYNDDGIDAVAKKMLPVLENVIAAKNTVFDDDFRSKYLGIVDSVFPRGAPAILNLRPMLCAYDSPMRGAYDHLHQVVRAGSVRSTRPVDSKDAVQLFVDYSAWGGAILITRKEIDALKKWTSVIDAENMRSIFAEAKKNNPFVWTMHRSKGGVIFIFVADDVDTMKALTDGFVAQGGVQEGAFHPQK